MHFKKLFKASIFLTSLLLFSNSSFGQRFFKVKDREKQYSTVGIGGGTSNYFGDLSPYSTFYYGFISNIRWNATVNYAKQFNDRWGVRVAYSYISLVGDVNTVANKSLSTPRLADLYLKNLHFRNNISEFTVSAVYDFLKPDGNGFKQRAKFIPYIAFGIGFFSNDPKAKADPVLAADQVTVESLGKWVSLRELKNEGQGSDGGAKLYSKIQFTMPISLGVKIRLREDLNLGIEGGLRITATDYLDDVSTGHYIDTYQTGIGYTSYRGFQNVNPRTGKSRIDDYKKAAQTLGHTINASNDIPQTGEEYYNGQVYNGVNRARGSSRKDSYFVTQFTLNYIIPSKIKCPN